MGSTWAWKEGQKCREADLNKEELGLRWQEVVWVAGDRQLIECVP